MHSAVESLTLLFAAGLVCSLVLTGLIRGPARRAGLIDKPDGRRKIHDRVVPVAGGLAVFATVLIVLLVAAAFSIPVEPHLDQPDLIGLLLGAAVICLVGAVDDCHRLRGRYKLLGQLAAVAVVILFGTQIRAISLFGWDLPLGWFAIPFTTFWLIAAVNSLNLLDGMDGLLGTVGTIICLAIAVMAAMRGELIEAGIAVVLAGALVGFLRYNLPPASIFLGDAGSMLIGLVVGTLAIRCSLKGPATVAIAAPIALLTIPLLDTTAAVVRRKLTGRSIYSTDRGHIHHCLLRYGLSRPRILLLVSALCILTVVGALASIAYRSELVAVLSVVVVVGTLIATRLFGHAEFVLLIQSGRELLRSVLGSTRRGQQLEVRLQGSAGWGELWARLTGCAEQLNLKSIALDVNAPAHHEGYHARWHCPGSAVGEEPDMWSAVLPLTAWGQTIGLVAVTGHADAEPVWQKLAVLTGVTDHVETVLAATAPVAPVTEPLVSVASA